MYRWAQTRTAATVAAAVIGMTTACGRAPLDEAKAAAALRGHARFARPIVIGVPMEASDDAGPPDAALARTVLGDRGILTLAEPSHPGFTARLTARGRDLLGSDGWALLEDGVRTLSVPVARRELVTVHQLIPDEDGGTLDFDWRWSMTETGIALRAAGVDLAGWGLRIDDRRTFRGGAHLALAGDGWVVRIVRPPISTKG